MTSPAAAQLNRIVQMVAELTRREREGGEPLTLAEIAERLGASPADIERDLRTLTAGGDSAEQDWLGSLSVIQEGGRVMVSSQGPFRRPIRLTPEEILAIQVGLATEPEAQPLTRELAALLDLKTPGAERWGTEVSAGLDEGRVALLARRGLNELRCLEILYAGSGRGEPDRRIIEVHQVVRDRGRTYLIAWCRRKQAPRHFRADRVLEARLLNEPFTPREEMQGGGDVVYSAPDDTAGTVAVRFSPAVARWLFEEHPAADTDEQGGVTIRYEVADPAWLVRTVLQYGPEAEVLGPDPYRVLMRSATSS